MSLTAKPRHVAAPTRPREQEGRVWSFADYGLQANPAQHALVLAVLVEVA